MFEGTACFAESDGSGGRERAMSMAGASGGVKDKDRKIGHRRVNEDGEVRIRSTHLLSSILLTFLNQGSV